MTQIDRRIEVTVGSVAAAPATKRALVSLSSLDRSTMRAGDARVRWGDQPDRNPHQGSQQHHTCAEVPRRMAFPPDEPFRVFQTYASSRSQCHGHQLAGFFGENLSLRGCFNLALNATPLVHRSPVLLSFQNRAQIWPPIAVRASYTGPDTNITADPLFCLALIWQWYSHSAAHIPLAVFPENLPLLTKDSTGQSQGTVDGSVSVGRDIEFAHALDHNPEIKAPGLPGLLHLGSVNQFGLEVRGLELQTKSPGSLSSFVEIRSCSAVSPAHKLSLTLARGDTGPIRHVRHGSCGFQVGTTEGTRQAREAICLIAGRMKFEFVRENYFPGSHTITIARIEIPRNPVRSRMSGYQYPDNGSLCFATGRLGSPASYRTNAGW